MNNKVFWICMGVAVVVLLPVITWLNHAADMVNNGY